MVEIKGWRNGLLVTLPDNVSSDDLIIAVQQRLDVGRNLEMWRGLTATIDFGSRVVSPADFDTIITTFRDEYGIHPTAIISTIQETCASAERLTLTIYDTLPNVIMPTVGVLPEPVKPPTVGQANALYIPHTVRSGQRILHNGPVIVNGDVNAGSEVVAAGDVVILGKLRGVAHAGANGDETARIFARSLQPPQLRIAGLYARAPEANTKASAALTAEFACVVNGAIDVKAW